MKTIGHDKSGREIVVMNGKYYRKNPDWSSELRVLANRVFELWLKEKRGMQEYEYADLDYKEANEIFEEFIRDLAEIAGG